MPWSAAIAAAGSIAGGLLAGSSAPSAPNVNVYQPTGTSSADSNLQSLLGQNYNLVSGANNPYTQYAPQFANLYNSIYNNPYQAGAQTSANAAGTGYTNTGTGGLNASTALYGALGPALTAGNSILNTAFDPQSQLYNQQLQQTTDASNVANAAYGLTGQQAAANTNQATTNFNIDWQNNELQRQLQGLQGYGQTLQNVGTAGTAAQNVGSAGAGAVAQGGSVPYQQSVLGTQNQSAALQQYIQALLGPQTSSQQTIANLGDYLGQGINASEAGQQAALNAYGAQLSAGAMGSNVGGGIGNSLNGLLGSGGFSFLNPSSDAAPAGAGGIADIVSAMGW